MVQLLHYQQIETIVEQKYRQIVLSNNRRVTVSNEDYVRLTTKKWHTSRIGTTEYAVRFDYIKPKVNGVYRTQKTYMHREILGLKIGDKTTVDHINHNGLDNRRENLRVVTKSENGVNRKKPARGVTKSRWGWIAQCSIGGHKYIGTYKTLQEARVAYVSYKKEKYGK